MRNRIEGPQVPVGGWIASRHHSLRPDGVLVGRGKHGAPCPIRDAPQQLVFVDRDVIGPIEFANAFGLLGYPRVAKEEDRHGGDPLEWFVAHAHTAAAVLELIGVYQSAQGTEAVSNLEGLFADNEKIVPPPRIIFLKAMSERDKAYHYLRALVNPNIRHVHREFGPFHTSRGPGPSLIRPRALFEAIYWQMADLADHPGQVQRRCKECGEFFIAEDPRQEYCPAPLSSRRSRCSSRLNVRKYRSRTNGGKEKP